MSLSSQSAGSKATDKETFSPVLISVFEEVTVIEEGRVFSLTVTSIVPETPSSLVAVMVAVPGATQVKVLEPSMLNLRIDSSLEV